MQYKRTQNNRKINNKNAYNLFFQVVLSDSIDEQSKLEKGRQELECPVCLELMKPPRR